MWLWIRKNILLKKYNRLCNLRRQVPKFAPSAHGGLRHRDNGVAWFLSSQMNMWDEIPKCDKFKLSKTFWFFLGRILLHVLLQTQRNNKRCLCPTNHTNVMGRCWTQVLGVAWGSVPSLRELADSNIHGAAIEDGGAEPKKRVSNKTKHWKCIKNSHPQKGKKQHWPTIRLWGCHVHFLEGTGMPANISGLKTCALRLHMLDD